MKNSVHGRLISRGGFTVVDDGRRQVRDEEEEPEGVRIGTHPAGSKFVQPTSP